MHKQSITTAVMSRQFSQELPAVGDDAGTAVGLLQLFTSPKDGSLRTTAKALRIEQGTLVVISQHADVETHGQIDAFPRIRAITDHVSQAEDLVDAEPPDFVEDNLQGLQVTMDIADYRGLHNLATSLRRGRLLRISCVTHLPRHPGGQGKCKPANLLFNAKRGNDKDVAIGCRNVPQRHHREASRSTAR